MLKTERLAVPTHKPLTKAGTHFLLSFLTILMLSSLAFANDNHVEKTMGSPTLLQLDAPLSLQTRFTQDIELSYVASQDETLILQVSSDNLDVRIQVANDKTNVVLAEDMWRSTSLMESMAIAVSAGSTTLFTLKHYPVDQGDDKLHITLLRGINDNQNEVLRKLSEVHFLSHEKKTKADRQRALAILTQIREQVSPTSELTMRILAELGYTHRMLRHYEQAETDYLQAIALAEQLNLPVQQSFLLNALAVMLDGRGHYERSRQYFFDALSVLGSDHGKAMHRGKIYNNIGLNYHRQGKLEQALDHYQRALEYFQPKALIYSKANTLNNLGGLYFIWGEPLQAEHYFSLHQQAIAEFEALYQQAYRKKAQTTLNLARLKTVSGKYQQAQILAEQAQQEFIAQDNLLWSSRALIQLGKIYHLQGEFRRGESFYHDALALKSEINDRAGELRTLINLAKLYLETNQGRQSLDTLVQAEHIAKAVGNASTLALVQAQILELYLLNPDMRPDQATLQLADIGGNDDKRVVAIKHYLAAMLSIENQDFNAAKLSLNLAIALFLAQQNHERQAKALYLLSQVQVAQNQLDKALASITDAINIIENIQKHIYQLDLKAAHLARFQHFYQQQVDIIYQLNRGQPTIQAKTTWQAKEHALARSFNLLVTEQRLRDQTPQHLLEQQQDIKGRLQAKYAAIQEIDAESGHSQQRDLLENELQQLTLKLDILEGQIRETFEASPLVSGPIALDAIQAQLDKDTVILDYQFNNNDLLLWLISADKVELQRLGDAEQINTLARDLYAKLKLPPAQRGHSVSAQLVSLGDTLITPILTLDKFKKLIIVTNENLRFLPFEALYSKATKTSGSYAQLLQQDKIISYAPSATAWYLLNHATTAQINSAQQAIAIFADPVFEGSDPRFLEQENATDTLISGVRTALPTSRRFERLGYSRTEARSIASLADQHQQSTRLLLDFDANKTALLQDDWRDYSVLHFATHGLVDQAYPRLSGLVFSQWQADGSGADAYLSIHDISNLNIAPQLVVLSACETAVGKRIQGEGLMSLSRAFFAKGSDQVIASLWPVQDNATAELMTHFYAAYWSSNQPSAARALTIAKQKLSQSRRWRDPYYWSGFILQGTSH